VQATTPNLQHNKVLLLCKHPTALHVVCAVS
jgi:hypothetical protein